MLKVSRFRNAQSFPWSQHSNLFILGLLVGGPGSTASGGGLSFLGDGSGLGWSNLSGPLACLGHGGVDGVHDLKSVGGGRLLVLNFIVILDLLSSSGSDTCSGDGGFALVLLAGLGGGNVGGLGGGEVVFVLVGGVKEELIDLTVGVVDVALEYLTVLGSNTNSGGDSLDLGHQSAKDDVDGLLIYQVC